MMKTAYQDKKALLAVYIEKLQSARLWPWYLIDIRMCIDEEYCGIARDIF